MIRSRLSILIGILLIIASCKKDDPVKVDVGYGYFPAEVGSWIIYDVDSTEWDDFNYPAASEVIPHRYQIKEVIESIFTDAEGREALRWVRYKRDTVTDPWVIKDVWMANKTASTVEMVEENERFVRLIFPVSLSKFWNGNSTNMQDEWDYQYTEVDAAKTVGGLSFDSTLTVTQIEYDDCLNLYMFEEYYAKNVGLIYKKAKHWDQPLVLCGWNADNFGGYDYIMTINSYSGQ